MDARDDRLEERLRGLGKALDHEIGPVDTDAGWNRVRSHAASAPRKPAHAQHRSRAPHPGRWVSAAAVLAAVLVATPYVLNQLHPKQTTPPATKNTVQGETVPIGNISGVDFLTPRDGFATAALGSYGAQNAVLSTTDGGTSWAVHRLPQGYTALAVHFTDDQKGYVLAQQTGLGQAGAASQLVPTVILATQDGAKSWHVAWSEPGAQALSNGTTLMRVGFQFFGSQGYAFVGDKVLTTTDGFKSWSPLTLPSGYEPVHMDFLTARTGFVASQQCPANQAGGSIAGCQPRLIQTTDGGQTWSTAFSPSGQNYWAYSGAVSFATSQDGWYFQKNSATWQGTLYQTTDGGRKWTLAQPNFAQGRTVAGAPTFVTPKVGWLPINVGAAPYPGGLLITRDGGATWTTASANQVWSLNSVSILSAKVGYAAGENPSSQQGFLVKTTDGGRTFTQVLPALSPSSLVEFPDTAHGFGIGIPSDGQAFIATTDGGKTWTQRSELPQGAMGLSFVSPNVGFAIAAPKNAGTSMQVLSTKDGGRHWQVRANLSAASGQLYATTPYVKFFDKEHGVLETEDYPQTVLEQTSDGGRTWTQMVTQTSTPGSWQQYDFLSQAVGFQLSTVVNQGQGTATLQRTTDGGKTWSTVQQFTNGDWGEAIYFSSAQDGWLAMQSAPATQNSQTVILQTTDGGKTWASHPVGGPALQPFNNSLLLQFPDAQNGWLLGNNGIYRSTDGGQTWTQQP